MNISNHNSDKTSISMISQKTKLENIKVNNLLKNKKGKGKNTKDGGFYSEVINSSISKNKLKNFISDELKNLSSKKYCYQNTEKNTENICGMIEDKNNQKIKNSSNFFEKMLENKNTFKKLDLFTKQNEEINNIDNNSIQSININNNIEGKQLYITKKSIDSNQKQSNSNIFSKNYLKKIILKGMIYFSLKIIILLQK